jgi:hypothetical protein
VRKSLGLAQISSPIHPKFIADSSLAAKLGVGSNPRAGQNIKRSAKLCRERITPKVVFFDTTFGRCPGPLIKHTVGQVKKCGQSSSKREGGIERQHRCVK